MATLTNNAISVKGRVRAKPTKIWDHKAYKSQIRSIFKIPNFIKKNQDGRLDQKSYLSNRER